MVVLLAMSTVAIWQEQEKTAEERDKTKTALDEKIKALAIRDQALEERKRALEKQTRYLYYAYIGLADYELSRNNISEALHYLQACPTDHRHFEWYYLYRRCHPLMTTKELPASLGAIGVTISPDGRRLAGVYRGMLKVLERPHAKLLYSRPLSKPIPSFRLIFTPDGQHLAVIGKEVQLIHLATGVLIRNFKAHSTRAISATFSRDGRLLAAGFPDNMIKVWQVSSGSEVCTCRGHSRAPIRLTSAQTAGAWQVPRRIRRCGFGKSTPVRRSLSQTASRESTPSLSVPMERDWRSPVLTGLSRCAMQPWAGRF
jgi:hypothetical protein